MQHAAHLLPSRVCNSSSMPCIASHSQDLEVVPRPTDTWGIASRSRADIDSRSSKAKTWVASNWGVDVLQTRYLQAWAYHERIMCQDNRGWPKTAIACQNWQVVIVVCHCQTQLAACIRVTVQVLTRSHTKHSNASLSLSPSRMSDRPTALACLQQLPKAVYKVESTSPVLEFST
jgi:hypothetical protein